MMHDLPTPAPSSDPPMPGSSPVKTLKADKLLASKTRPFAPLDLNVVGCRAKAFQDAREKAGATPPPSSPPASSVFFSSPTAPTREQALGFSPVKQQRPFSASTTPARSIVLEQSPANLDRAVIVTDAQTLGLVENPERESDADAVPNLLFGSKNVSLVIGRSKPSGQPHASSASNAADIPASMQGLGSKKILRVNLPNEARHVSRIHAIVEWIPFVTRPVSKNPAKVSSFTAKGSPVAAKLSSQNYSEPATPHGTFIVRIVGQNGLIVDGKRRREGQVLRLTSGKSLIDFFGVKCLFRHVPSSGEPQPSPVKSMQARVQQWTQRVTSPVKKATPSSVDRFRVETNVATSSPPASSPPPMLALMSPSKRAAQSAPVNDDGEAEDDFTSSPTPMNRRGGGLVAGPLNHQQVRAGDSDQEAGTKGLDTIEDDDDEDDESDDDDYVPAERGSAKQSMLVIRKPTTDLAADDEDEDSSSLSDLDSGVVDQQIGDSALATQPTSVSAAPAPTLGQRGSTSDSNNAESSKPAVADALTESQVQMPPPPAAASVANVRNAARRSASSSPAPSSPMLGSSVQELQSIARNCVRQLASTYDLPGLLAGAVVFHRTATISASEAVRSVLSTTPGLMKGEAGEHSVAFSPSKRKLPGATTLQHGCVVDGWPTTSESNERWASIARKAWREHLEVVLQSSPMFGVIQRAGKDASGNPLECWYYYDKENDTDKERAENLGVFAKPMRKALKGQKPIFWKRSGYARQQDDNAEAKDPASDAVAASPSRRMDQESMDIASAPLPASSIGRKRKAKAQSQAETQSADGAASQAVNDDERRREKLRAKIAKSGLWDETQPEEKEAPTWDRKGDQDYKKGRK